VRAGLVDDGEVMGGWPLPVVTAGAYLVLDGRFPFMVGPTARGDALGVVRLGGHRERGEAPWDCAAREVREEAGLTIRHVAPPQTYWFEDGAEPDALVPGDWPVAECGVAPLLAIRKGVGVARRLMPMYLARAAGNPIPLAETRGLLLLSPAEVCSLIATPPTLDQFVRAGGCAILRDTLPAHLPLEPFLPLRLLAALLARHPDLGAAPRG
jgi:8-oxo-dGTP pyrophosphatase MutT (NUDIX family)